MRKSITRTGYRDGLEDFIFLLLYINEKLIFKIPYFVLSHLKNGGSVFSLSLEWLFNI